MVPKLKTMCFCYVDSTLEIQQFINGFTYNFYILIIRPISIYSTNRVFKYIQAHKIFTLSKLYNNGSWSHLNLKHIMITFVYM